MLKTFTDDNEFCVKFATIITARCNELVKTEFVCKPVWIQIYLNPNENIFHKSLEVINAYNEYTFQYK